MIPEIGSPADLEGVTVREPENVTPRHPAQTDDPKLRSASQDGPCSHNISDTVTVHHKHSAHNALQDICTDAAWPSKFKVSSDYSRPPAILRSYPSFETCQQLEQFSHGKFPISHLHLGSVEYVGHHTILVCRWSWLSGYRPDRARSITLVHQRRTAAWSVCVC
jgi:hypothetical protein